MNFTGVKTYGIYRRGSPVIPVGIIEANDRDDARRVGALAYNMTWGETLAIVKSKVIQGGKMSEWKRLEAAAEKFKQESVQL